MAEYINGINPTIVKWARVRSGYTLEDVATSLNKAVETISNWESGEQAPTYVQLEKLADKYKRPIATFFFPEPPQEPNFVGSICAAKLRNCQTTPRHPYSVASGVREATFIDGIEYGCESCGNENLPRSSCPT